MIRTLGLVVMVVLVSFVSRAQNPAMDKLEMLYAQGHYKMVYRKSNRLLDNPEYDYSWLPTYYKSLAMFQLTEKEFWSDRHPTALQLAHDLFMEVKKATDGKLVLEMHVNEIDGLKEDLISRLVVYKEKGLTNKYLELEEIIANIFGEVPVIDGKPNEVPVIEPNEEFTFNASDREEVIAFAKKQLGVPYQWAGTTPSGFDCSGFTTYVMGAYQKELPRRAADQYDASRKLREKNVQKGDLVFFENGSGISHVGIIVSSPGEPLTMIHASTTQGITITNIETSSYWSKRLVGFGTYL